MRAERNCRPAVNLVSFGTGEQDGRKRRPNRDQNCSRQGCETNPEARGTDEFHVTKSEPVIPAQPAKGGPKGGNRNKDRRRFEDADIHRSAMRERIFSNSTDGERKVQAIRNDSETRVDRADRRTYRL